MGKTTAGGIRGSGGLGVRARCEIGRGAREEQDGGLTVGRERRQRPSRRKTAAVGHGDQPFSAQGGSAMLGCETLEKREETEGNTWGCSPWTGRDGRRPAAEGYSGRRQLQATAAPW
jgi:hypothetical protein